MLWNPGGHWNDWTRWIAAPWWMGGRFGLSWDDLVFRPGVTPVSQPQPLPNVLPEGFSLEEGGGLKREAIEPLGGGVPKYPPTYPPSGNAPRGDSVQNKGILKGGQEGTQTAPPPPPPPTPPAPTPPAPTSPPAPPQAAAPRGFSLGQFLELMGRVPPQFWMAMQQPRLFPWSVGDIVGTLWQAYSTGRDIAEQDLKEEWRQALVHAQTLPEEMRMQYLDQVRNEIAEKAASLGVRSPITAVPQFEITTVPLSEADPKSMENIKQVLRARGVKEDRIDAIAAMYGGVRVTAYRTRDGRVIPRASEVADVSRNVINTLLTKAIDDLDKIDYPVELPDGSKVTLKITPDTALTVSINEKRWLEDKKWREMLFQYEKEWREREFGLREREFNINRAKSALTTAIELVKNGADPEKALNAALNVLGIKPGEVSPELYAVIRGVGDYIRENIKDERELRRMQLQLVRYQLDYERQTLPLRIEAAKKELQRIEAEIRATGVKSAADALRLQEARARLNAFNRMSEIIASTPPDKWAELTSNKEFIANMFKVDPNAAIGLLNLSPEKVDPNLVMKLATEGFNSLEREVEMMRQKGRPAHERAALVVKSIRESLLNLDPRKLDQNGRTILENMLRRQIEILDSVMREVDPKYIPDLAKSVLEIVATSENLRLPRDVRERLLQALKTAGYDSNYWTNVWKYFVDRSGYVRPPTGY